MGADIGQEGPYSMNQDDLVHGGCQDSDWSLVDLHMYFNTKSHEVC